MKSLNNLLVRIGKRLRQNSGFSNLEMIITIGLVGVIGTIAAVQMTGDREQDTASAVGQMFVGDLAFAQNLAMSTTKGVVFTFTPGTDECNEEEGEGEEGGCGDGSHDNRCRGRGNGHDEDVRGEGMNGRGRGHGYGYGHAHHGCGDGCGGGSAGGYGIQFSDGSEITYPQAATADIKTAVTINPNVLNFRFDSVGRLIVPNYNWASGQTTILLFTINGKVGVEATRETGKARVIKL